MSGRTRMLAGLGWLAAPLLPSLLPSVFAADTRECIRARRPASSSNRPQQAA